MIKFLGKLFGSDSAINKGLDIVTNAGDAVVFTKEEKADYWLRLLKAYEPFKIAQRFLALIVGIPFVFIYVLSQVIFLASAFMSPETFKLVDEVTREMALRNQETLGEPFKVIATFYFGGGALEGIVRTARAGK